ncbi:hypothetical protein [Trujillonella humicola]|uniref:hypothetical protein n=1 Tax=Trujillonella humicola TaxID=3383699 RepID=UPI0039068D5B
MSILVFAVPALLVVVAGYAVGFTVAGWCGASATVCEGIGWTTGLVLLVAVVVAALRWHRRRTRRM